MALSSNNKISNKKQDQNSSGFLILAKSCNVHIISNILSTICFKKDQLTVVTLKQNGVKFSVEESKSVQGNAFLNREIWQEYHYSSIEEATFTINLTIFLECLNIYGSSSQQQGISPAVQIAYRGYGTPLLVMLEANDVLTDCSIRTLEAESMTAFNLKNAGILCKLIVNSENLRDAIIELDWNNDSCTWLVSNEHPYFRLSTDGTCASCQIDYLRESEAFEEFSCTRLCEFRYKMKLLQPIFKALFVAQKSQIRINEEGLLAMEHKIQNEDGTSSFVGFYLVPLELEDI